MDKMIGFKLPEELVEELKRTAKMYGIKQGAIAQSALEREIARIKKEHKPFFEKK